MAHLRQHREIRTLYIYDIEEEVQVVLDLQGETRTFFNAVWTDELNRRMQLTFEVLSDHEGADHIKEAGWVGFADFDGNFQFFEIKEVVETHGEALTKQVICEDVLYEMLDDIIDTRFSGFMTAQQAMNYVIGFTRWDVGDVESTGQRFIEFEIESALSGLRKIQSVFNLDVETEMVLVRNRIDEGFVHMRERRGRNVGKQFVYSKDVREIERNADVYGMKTALYGVGAGGMSFAQVSWSIAQGDPTNKPLGQKYVEDTQAKQERGRDVIGGVGLRNRFGIYEDFSIDNEIELLEATWAELQQIKTPRVSYQLDVVDLEVLIGLEHEGVRIGDTVRVIDQEFQPPLIVETRVVAIERYLDRPEDSRVTLDNFAQRITDDVDPVATINGAEPLPPASAIFASMQFNRTLPPNQLFDMPYENTVYDILGEWDDSTFRFTPERDGYYLIIPSVGSDLPFDVHMQWWNGSFIREIMHGGFGQLVRGSIVERLTGGTEYRVRIINVGTQDMQITAENSYLTITRITG